MLLTIDNGRFRFCELETARHAASRRITALLDIFVATKDCNEKEVLAQVLRIAGGYVGEIRRQRDTSAIAEPAHYRDLMRLHLDALWWIDALTACGGQPATCTETMISLLRDAAEFFKVTVRDELEASLKADAELGTAYELIDDEAVLTEETRQ